MLSILYLYLHPSTCHVSETRNLFSSLDSCIFFYRLFFVVVRYSPHSTVHTAVPRYICVRYTCASSTRLPPPLVQTTQHSQLLIPYGHGQTFIPSQRKTRVCLFDIWVGQMRLFFFPFLQQLHRTLGRHRRIFATSNTRKKRRKHEDTKTRREQDTRQWELNATQKYTWFFTRGQLLTFAKVVRQILVGHVVRVRTAGGIPFVAAGKGREQHHC